MLGESGGSGRSCAAPVRTVGTCSTQAVTGGPGEERGSRHALQCPSVPRASFARQEHLRTDWGPCNLFLAAFPCQSRAGGAAWGLCGSLRPWPRGSPPVGWDSRATGVVTLQRWHQRAFPAAVQGTRQFWHQSSSQQHAWLAGSAAPCPSPVPNHLLPPKQSLSPPWCLGSAALPALPLGHRLAEQWIWLCLEALLGALKSSR